MINYNESIKIIEDNLLAVESEIISIDGTLNRISDEEILAPFPLPRFNNSMMDGFALLSDSTKNASKLNPKKFIVNEIIAAGNTSKFIPIEDHNIVCEIMTGAPLPTRFDCVIPIEDVKVTRNENSKFSIIEIYREVSQFENIRFIGEDYLKDDPIICSNEQFTSEKIMALSSFGIKKVKVKKKIKIAIFSTGNEIEDDFTKNIDDYKIFNSSLKYLNSMISKFPVEVKTFNTVPDDKSLFSQTMEKIINEDFQLVISTGAVSKGKWDFIPECLIKMGAEILFHRVSIKPGKPILFSKINKNLFYFGLPGNPISTAVGFRFFVGNFLRKTLGLGIEKKYQLRLDSKGKKKLGMTFFLKSEIYINEDSVLKGKILEGQESFKIKPLSKCNGWIILENEISDYHVNDRAYFLPLDMNTNFFN